MLRSLKASQRLPRLMAIQLTNAGSVAVAEGGADVTAVRNGAGDVTVTFRTPFKRAPVVVATAKTTRITPEINTLAVGSVRIVTKDNAGSATDTDLHVMVWGWDDASAV